MFIHDLSSLVVSFSFCIQSARTLHGWFLLLFLSILTYSIITMGEFIRLWLFSYYSGGFNIIFPLDTTIKQYGESPWTFLGFRQGIFLLLSTFLWQIPDWTMIQPIHSWKIQSLLTYFWLNWHRRVNLNFGIPHAKQWTSHINSRWSWSSKVWVQDELTVGWFINRNV